MPKQALEAISPAAGPNGLVNKFYQGITPRDLNPLDLIARRLIAFKFTNVNVGGDAIREAMRDIETIACAVVGAGTLLVAHNYRFGNRGVNLNHIGLATQSVWAELQAEGFINITGYHVIHPSANRATSFHAEMQILEYCGANNVPIQGGVIGVSKPCCRKCSRVLNMFRIDHSLFAGPPIGDWDGPKTDTVPRTGSPAL